MGPNGDTADSATFGGAVAAPFRANPQGSVGKAFNNSISSVTDGGGCTNSGYSFGGGINGCGCDTVVSYAGNFTNAQTLIDTTWIGLEQNSSLANSAVQGAYYAGCNYNIGTSPWYGGN